MTARHGRTLADDYDIEFEEEMAQWDGRWTPFRAKPQKLRKPRPTEKELEAARAAIQPDDDRVSGAALGRLLGAGIYCIVQRETNDCYIGRSRDLLGRFVQHLKMMAKGDHHAGPMQAAVDQFGLASLDFRVLERCDPIIHEEREMHWIRTLRPQFNVIYRSLCDRRSEVASDIREDA